jgi:hypothetical protein
MAALISTCTALQQLLHPLPCHDILLLPPSLLLLPQQPRSTTLPLEVGVRSANHVLSLQSEHQLVLWRDDTSQHAVICLILGACIVLLGNPFRQIEQPWLYSQCRGTFCMLHNKNPVVTIHSPDDPAPRQHQLAFHAVHMCTSTCVWDITRVGCLLQARNITCLYWQTMSSTALR